MECGFTLVELLVVIAIIGVLVALLLPAVQGAREAARRSQCANNLRQLGLAVINYENASKILPAGSYWIDTSVPQGQPARLDRGNLLVYILPFIEEQSLSDKFDPDSNFFSRQAMGPPGSPLVASQIVPAFTCPSATNPTTARPYTESGYPVDPLLETAAMFNYAASRGSTGQITNPACACASLYAVLNRNAIRLYPDVGDLKRQRNFSGPFTRLPFPVRLQRIRDGLSKTIFIGEIRPNCNDHAAEGWVSAHNSNGLISTITPINFDTCREQAPNQCYAWCNWLTALGFSSNHQGGAHFSLGDGSVHFLSETIDMATYQYLGEKNDGRTFALE